MSTEVRSLASSRRDLPFAEAQLLAGPGLLRDGPSYLFQGFLTAR